MDTTELGITSVARLLQPRNANAPIEATLSPMLTEARLLQLSKALEPIETTELGIATEASAVL
jgi:hypothetical protein